MTDTPPEAQPRNNLPLIIVGAVGVALVVVVVIILIVGGGSSDNNGRNATPTVIDSDQVTIDISDFKFDPSNVTVPLGATVTWVNHDSALHDATDDDGAWDTGTLAQDDEGSISFDTAGAYDYHCSIHPYMKARLTVEEN